MDYFSSCFDLPPGVEKPSHIPMSTSKNKPTYRYQVSRRQFLYSSAVAATGAVLLPGCATTPNVRYKSANEKLNIGVIGAGGKGSSDTDSCAKENIVALCDVDTKTLDSRGAKYPSAQKFQDFRKMLEKVKEIDAVIVATPDHMHAYAGVMAMKMGKHAFIQKPLAQSVYECRLLRRVARENHVATQMGNQGSAGDGLRRAVEVIQAGVIGKPLELHVWSNRPIWPQGIDRPPGEDPIPETLNWDTWIGPAPMRPFKKDVYHTFKWRGWKDFGTGALGDMACHTVNMPFRALKLGYPNVVECEEHSKLFADTYPKTSRIRFEFPAREGLPPLKFWWYDGNPSDKEVKALRPNPDLTKEIPGIPAMKSAMPIAGCLVIGEKGKLFSPDDYGSQFYMMRNGESNYTAGSDHEAAKAVPQTIARSPGHYVEWLNACRGGTAAYSNFEIAGYLTEIILLGCVAMRAGKKIDWDGPNARATNAPEVAQFVKRQYRKGWEL